MQSGSGWGKEGSQQRTSCFLWAGLHLSQEAPKPLDFLISTRRELTGSKETLEFTKGHFLFPWTDTKTTLPVSLEVKLSPGVERTGWWLSRALEFLFSTFSLKRPAL